MVHGHELLLLKPQTYMNRSGSVLIPLRDQPEFDPSRDLLILVDDFALPVGRFRLRGAGSAGGHNGLKSVEGTLRRQDYARLRIGVGPPPLEDRVDFVLSEFEPEEEQVLEELLVVMGDAVECWVEEGIEVAMRKFNKKASDAETGS
jgi:PTH1 family peptidyl-tRNA hydrolase